MAPAPEAQAKPYNQGCHATVEVDGQTSVVDALGTHPEVLPGSHWVLQLVQSELGKIMLDMVNKDIRSAPSGATGLTFRDTQLQNNIGTAFKIADLEFKINQIKAVDEDTAKALETELGEPIKKIDILFKRYKAGAPTDGEQQTKSVATPKGKVEVVNLPFYDILKGRHERYTQQAAKQAKVKNMQLKEAEDHLASLEDDLHGLNGRREAAEEELNEANAKHAEILQKLDQRRAELTGSLDVKALARLNARIENLDRELTMAEVRVQVATEKLNKIKADQTMLGKKIAETQEAIAKLKK
ncbi:unnamed protein product [Pedinophyceae sp. YPF-701]|nr:unnamed protein product [Pedinophyceae sp. YPF-701]